MCLIMLLPALIQSIVGSMSIGLPVLFCPQSLSLKCAVFVLNVSNKQGTT